MTQKLSLGNKIIATHSKNKAGLMESQGTADMNIANQGATESTATIAKQYICLRNSWFKLGSAAAPCKNTTTGLGTGSSSRAKRRILAAFIESLLQQQPGLNSGRSTKPRH